MPRVLSETIKAVLAAQHAESHDIIEITIPDSSVIYISSAAIQIGTQQYEPLLASISAIKFSKGKAPDNAEFQIRNENSAYAGLLSEPDRVLSGAGIVIKRAFLVTESPRTFETDILFIGNVNEWRVDQDFIRISVVSDMFRRGALLAGRPLTQRCIWVFKSTECGYVNGQGGSTDVQVPGQAVGVTTFNFCDKVFDSAFGCQGHVNKWRFGGVPPLTPNVRIVTADDSANDFRGYDQIRSGFDWDWNRSIRERDRVL